MCSSTASDYSRSPLDWCCRACTYRVIALLTAAAKKISARWGKPDDWGRPQVAALVLLAHAPGLALDDLWPDSDSPDQFIAHGVRLLLARPELKALRGTVRDFLRSVA